jgi:penicillin-binding protein 1A
MSSNTPNDDLDRFLNDPEYRRKKLKEQKNEAVPPAPEEKPVIGLGKPKPITSTAPATKKQEQPGQQTPAIPKPEAAGSFANKTNTFLNRIQDFWNDPDRPILNFKKKDRKPISWGVIAGTWVLLAAAGVSTFFLFYAGIRSGLPSIQELENPKTDIATLVKARDGAVLDKYFTENRQWVKIDQISPNVVNALIAIEDHRFYEHWGIDLFRTAAIPYHLLRGRPQGGSTITQQLARNLYKKIGREVSVTRKLSEMATAIQIERNYTKQEILEMYLNTVEFSNSSFGIESASQTHYGKPAKELSIPEAATLVGTLQAIYMFNPRIRAANALRKRNLVMFKMVEHGFLAKAEYDSLKEQPLNLDYHPPFKTGRKSRYFGEYVRQKIQNWAKENGLDIYRDGLIIHTTIDSRMQEHAQKAVKLRLDSLQKVFVKEWTSKGGSHMDKLWKKYPLFLDSFLSETYEYRKALDSLKDRRMALDHIKKDKAFVDSTKKWRTRLEAGFVAIEPTTGQILAWIGGSDYSKFQYDHVYMARRQAGSTFKPFVYTVAIDNGFAPYHRMSKYPTRFYDRSGRVWAPSDEQIPEGDAEVTLRTALARSMNNVTVRLLPELAGKPGTNKLEDLFPAANKIVDMAHNLGVKSKLDAYPSIALGTAEVTLLEIVSSYTTYANKGVHFEPYAISRIEDKNGNVLAEFKSESQREAISQETAYIIIDMLRGTIRGAEGGFGTGVRLRNEFGVTQDIAGKTGTTQNSADNWFIAMTPSIVMGAWVGGEDRRIRFPENTWIGQGARTSLPIVGEFIRAAREDKAVNWSYEAFEQPEGFIMPEPEKQVKEPAKNQKLGRTGW